MTKDNDSTVWPIIAYRDARAAIAFLRDAFGFEENALYARDDDPTIIEHAEMRSSLGGGVMLGTAGKDDSPFGQRAPGSDSVYVVCDDPDEIRWGLVVTVVAALVALALTLMWLPSHISTEETAP